MFLLQLHPNKSPARVHAFHHFQVSSLCVKEMYIEFILKIETSQQKRPMKTTVLPLKLKSLNKSKPGLGAVVKNLEKVVEQLTTRSCNLIFNIRNYAVEK